MLSKTIFAIASSTLAIGIVQNFRYDGMIASTGTMSMNSYYLLATALYVASMAANLIFEVKATTD